MQDKPRGAGRSSFGLIDSERLLAELAIGKDLKVADLGCGVGEYALAVARNLSGRALVFAIDLWEEGIRMLKEKMARNCVENVIPIVADIRSRIPLSDGSIDVALAFTVLHDILQDGDRISTVREVSRILKPSGRFMIVEFKKIEGPPGPPLGVRISPDELTAYLEAASFSVEKNLEISSYHYLVIAGKA